MMVMRVKWRRESCVSGLIWDLLKLKDGFKARKSLYSHETCSKGLFGVRIVMMVKDMARQDESLASEG